MPEYMKEAARQRVNIKTGSRLIERPNIRQSGNGNGLSELSMFRMIPNPIEKPLKKINSFSSLQPQIVNEGPVANRDIKSSRVEWKAKRPPKGTARKVNTRSNYEDMHQAYKNAKTLRMSPESRVNNYTLKNTEIVWQNPKNARRELAIKKRTVKKSQHKIDPILTPASDFNEFAPLNSHVTFNQRISSESRVIGSPWRESRILWQAERPTVQPTNTLNTEMQNRKPVNDRLVMQHPERKGGLQMTQHKDQISNIPTKQTRTSREQLLKPLPIEQNKLQTVRNELRVLAKSEAVRTPAAASITKTEPRLAVVNNMITELDQNPIKENQPQVKSDKLNTQARLKKKISARYEKLLQKKLKLEEQIEKNKQKKVKQKSLNAEFGYRVAKRIQEKRILLIQKAYDKLKKQNASLEIPGSQVTDLLPTSARQPNSIKSRLRELIGLNRPDGSFTLIRKSLSGYNFKTRRDITVAARDVTSQYPAVAMSDKPQIDENYVNHIVLGNHA